MPVLDPSICRVWAVTMICPDGEECVYIASGFAPEQAAARARQASGLRVAEKPVTEVAADAKYLVLRVQ